MGYQICPNGITLDVTEGGPKVLIVEGARIEPVLPKVPRAFPSCVQVQRIAAVCAAQGGRQRAGLIRNRNRHQVDVVVHQAESENPCACLSRVGREPLEVRAAVGVSEKHALMVDAALGNVVRYSDCNGAGKPRHTLRKCPCAGDFSLRTIAPSLEVPWAWFRSDAGCERPGPRFGYRY